MSLKTLLNVPPILSKLKQAYSIMNSDAEILWSNVAFQKSMYSSVLSQLKEELKSAIEPDLRVLALATREKMICRKCYKRNPKTATKCGNKRCLIVNCHTKIECSLRFIKLRNLQQLSE